MRGNLQLRHSIVEGMISSDTADENAASARRRRSAVKTKAIAFGISHSFSGPPVRRYLFNTHPSEYALSSTLSSNG